MGLTISYDLHAPTMDSDALARDLMVSLHEFAKKRPVEKCSDLIEWKKDIDEPRGGRFHHWYIPLENTGDTPEYLSVEPLNLVKFSFNHPGSETAWFGLAQYPSHISDKKRKIRDLPTGLVGWHWHNFCKTQYASLPHYGGWDNFFAIHNSICATLHEAQQLGLTVNVRDDGDFWSNRNVETLHGKLEHWNALIAAFTGKFKDALSDRGQVVAPITKDPAFEHLEAKGQNLLGSPGSNDISKVDHRDSDP